MGRISAPHCIEEALTKGMGDTAPASISGALGPEVTIGIGGRRGALDATAELLGSEPECQMPDVRARLAISLEDIRRILSFEETEDAIDRGARLGYVRLDPRLGTGIDRFAVVLARVGQRL